MLRHLYDEGVTWSIKKNSFKFFFLNLNCSGGGCNRKFRRQKFYFDDLLLSNLFNDLTANFLTSTSNSSIDQPLSAGL